jgi:hypothetical protein
MFVVIYRSYLKPHKEDEYKQLWRKITTFFIEHRNALGSALHKAEDGMWLAYSRWPDKKTRDASWPDENMAPLALPEEIKETIMKLKNCLDLDRPLPEIHLELVDDLLFNRIK